MTNSIFTPKADDSLATARELPTEYAMVKSSGYLVSYGFGPGALAAAVAYSTESGGRVIVERPLSAQTWLTIEQAVTAPDSLEGLI